MNAQLGHPPQHRWPDHFVALPRRSLGIGWVNLVSAATGPDGAVEWGLRTLHGKQGLWLLVSLLMLGFLDAAGRGHLLYPDGVAQLRDSPPA